MSLIKCMECGKEISSFAVTCPHCGYPIQKTTISKNNSGLLYCKVVFIDSVTETEYYYISNDYNVCVGDYSLVIANNEEGIVRIKDKIFCLSERDYPFPPEKTKRLERILNISDQDYLFRIFLQKVSRHLKGKNNNYSYLCKVKNELNIMLNKGFYMARNIIDVIDEIDVNNSKAVNVSRRKHTYKDYDDFEDNETLSETNDFADLEDEGGSYMDEFDEDGVPYYLYENDL